MQIGKIKYADNIFVKGELRVTVLMVILEFKKYAKLN